MKLPRSRRAWAVLAALLLILFLYRPGVYRLRSRIAGSIGSALGRKVALDNVRVHFLPRPGFDLEGLVIYDDPAFSAEPMVRAQDVSASIRLRSLLRGRLEIARLSAAEPSINLVRNDEGRWNLADLLERNARFPAAPTAKAASGRRPAFPYLEAAHARINLKLGQEKKPYALTDAEVALWQESENSWGARIRAEPVRTDFNLTDTGLVELSATWRRAANLRTTPMQVAMQWQKGQLGQITKLLSGKDRGWRGAVSFSANLSGTPEALLIRSEMSVADFHRYDIQSNDGVRLAADCAGRYNVVVGILADLRCESPLSSGTLKLTGSLGPRSGGLSYDLKLAVDKVPLASVVRVLHQAKRQLPPDLTATGLLSVYMHAVRKGVRAPRVEGEGEATKVQLSANGGKEEIAFGDVPLKIISAHAVQSRARKATARGNAQEPAEPHLRIGSFAFAMGAPAPTTAGGWISTSGYAFTLRGDATLKNLYRLANMLGLSGFRRPDEGVATVDMSVAGAWQGFVAPAVVGAAQLHNVRAEVRGLNTPLEIGSARVVLRPDSVLLQQISAQLGNTHWSGSVTVPRPCVPPDCESRFDLAADKLSIADLHEWFTGHATKHPWYRFLSEQGGASALLQTRARGTLRIDVLGVKKLLATEVATQLELHQGTIVLRDLRAELLGGSHQGSWTIDVSGQPVKYHAAGQFENVSLTEISALMRAPWLTGTADAKFEGTASGNSFADLLANADAQFRFVIRNGSLPHVESPDSARPFSVHRLAGNLRLHDGTWELSAARLESHDGLYQASGRAAPGSGLNFTLHRSDGQSWVLFGTLAKLRLERNNRTQAEARIPSKQ